MQSFASSWASPTIDAEANRMHAGVFALGEMQNVAGFRLHDDTDLARNAVFAVKSGGQTINSGSFQNLNSSNIDFVENGVVSAQLYPSQRAIPLANAPFENWGNAAVASASPQTDTSTDVETDDKNQWSEGGHHLAITTADSSEKSKERTVDLKTQRRLAQNREAARKSRLRKKAYVQQLENCRLKLTQIEQELLQARQQGVFVGSVCVGDQSHVTNGNGALAFDMEYSRWLDEQQRLSKDLRTAVNSHVGDNELRLLVDAALAHYDELFRLKSNGVKADVFHMLSGMWKTPAERCFLWLGGFRSSELLKILVKHLEPLTEQQLMGLYNLQESSQQAEEALSQGMEALQQSLAETLASGTPGSSDNVANYMGQMATAMGKLGTLEGFLLQADNLRQQTLQQMHRILTTRQVARALLCISDYFSRLRALSSLWSAHPRE